MKRLFQILAIGLIILVATLFARALMLEAPAAAASALTPIPIDSDGIAKRISEAIRFETISNQAPGTLDPEPFEAFIAWTAATYPDFHESLKLERIGTYSLLYTWEGTDSVRSPILLTGQCRSPSNAHGYGKSN